MIYQSGDIRQIDLCQQITINISILLTTERQLADIDAVDQSGDVGKIALTICTAITVAGKAARIKAATTAWGTKILPIPLVDAV